MSHKPESRLACQSCGKIYPAAQLAQFEMIGESTNEIIKERLPEWSSGKYVCRPCLNVARVEGFRRLLEQERGELSSLQEEVVSSLKAAEILTQDINKQYDAQLSFGERLSDKLAEFGGSWGFISLFALSLFIWILINASNFLAPPFDPYPFILLNLILSCLAAIQAPIIMMSQNRQEAKDRLRAENDYRVNLKAELEIQHLGLKLDNLITHQWNRLLEIQRLQMELLSDLENKK